MERWRQRVWFDRGLGFVRVGIYVGSGWAAWADPTWQRRPSASGPPHTRPRLVLGMRGADQPVRIGQFGETSWVTFF